MLYDIDGNYCLGFSPDGFYKTQLLNTLEWGTENHVHQMYATKTGSYTYSWRIPTSGTGSIGTNWNTNMLYNTGGTFTSNPSINTTYYVENQPI